MVAALTSLEIAALIRDITLVTFFAIGTLALLIGLILGLRFYKRTRGLIDRVDAGVDRVEALVESVDSTASTVKKTATSMNRGMSAGGFARSAMSSVFGRGSDDSESGESNGKSD